MEDWRTIVRDATWAEIDLDAKRWTIPAERMKAGKEHRVPLSTRAMVLLKSLESSGGIVFPGRHKETFLSDLSLTAVLRRMSRGDITVHGFRSSFRDWCSEEVGNVFSREVCEHAPAHSLPDKVEAAYRRGDLLETRILFDAVLVGLLRRPVIRPIRWPHVQPPCRSCVIRKSTR